MRRTSDKRRARNQGRPIPDLPWLGNRPADETVGHVVQPVLVAPDLSVPRFWATAHGLVTLSDIARATGIPAARVRLWAHRNPYWPPARATLAARGAPRLYAVPDVRLFLAWVDQDPHHWRGLTPGSAKYRDAE